MAPELRPRREAGDAGPSNRGHSMSSSEGEEEARASPARIIPVRVAMGPASVMARRALREQQQAVQDGDVRHRDQDRRGRDRDQDRDRRNRDRDQDRDRRGVPRRRTRSRSCRQEDRHQPRDERDQGHQPREGVRDRRQQPREGVHGQGLQPQGRGHGQDRRARGGRSTSIVRHGSRTRTPARRRSTRGRSRRGSRSRSTRGTRSRSTRRGRSSSPSRMSRKMLDLTQTVKKLERKQKDNFTFKNKGIEKQAIFVQEMGEWLEDNLRIKMETEMGLLPAGLKDVIKAGEKLLGDRLHLLKIADLYGWGAVTEFTATELARNEAEEKKLKKIVKQNELKQEKAKEKKQYTGRYNRSASGDEGDGDRKSGGPKDGKARDDRECFNCGKKGHLKFNCRAAPKDGGSGSGRRRT